MLDELRQGDRYMKMAYRPKVCREKTSKRIPAPFAGPSLTPRPAERILVIRVSQFSSFPPAENTFSEYPFREARL